MIPGGRRFSGTVLVLFFIGPVPVAAQETGAMPDVVDLPASSSPPPVVSKAPPRATIPKPKPKLKPGCNPPFRVDKDGVRIPKPECFQK